MPGEDDQRRSPKTEPPAPAREQPSAGKHTLRGAAKFLGGAAKFLGGSVGCLVFLALAAFLAVGVVAIFFDDPVLWIACIALLVALSARKTARAVGKR